MKSEAAGKQTEKKVGIIGLVAIVLSAMVGAGVFNLPGEMAATASAGSQMIAWAITGVGMWFIADTFRTLTKIVPDLKNGIYAYASSGFGRLAGFFISYGYWICNCFAQAAYGVLIMTTMDFFFPGVFGDGNNLPSIACASVLCWIMFFINRRGAHFGALVNVVGTIGKILPILVFVIMMITAFQFSMFIDAFWGSTADGLAAGFDLASVGSQVSSTMLITLFLFVGIEGAVVLSDKAKNQRDVSHATVTGYLVVLALYVLVSILPLGVFPQSEVAAMANPSMATLMGARFGPIGELVVNIGIIISILSAWLVWIMMLAEMPLFAARDGIFPKAFARVNKHGAPSFSLLATTIVCQVLLIGSMFLSSDAFQRMVSITSVMAMPCYLVCCLFLLKLARAKEWHECGTSRRHSLVVGAVGSIFAVYLLYASGLHYLMIACLLYAVGTPLFIIGRRQNGDAGKLSSIFSHKEKGLVGVILVLGVIGLIYVLISGTLF